MKVSNILFRPSEIHQIMSKPRTKKTNADKYADLQKKVEKAQEEANLNNPDKKLQAAAEYNLDLLSKQLKDLEPLKDLPNLSATCQKYLKQKFVEVTYGRRKEIDNKYMKKGREVEEASITLYSLIKNKIYKNNKERRENAYFTGEIDLPVYDANGVEEEITDIKSSYDAFTFIDNLFNIKAANKYQGLGYMDLYPTVKRYNIANVLSDNTDDAVLNALYYESFKWVDNDTPTWRELEIIKSHIYTKQRFLEFVNTRGCMPNDEKSQEMYDSFIEIPLNDKLIEHTFQRDNLEIQAVKDQIDLCREWMRIVFNLEK